MRRTIHLCQRGLPVPLRCLACGEIAESGEESPLPHRQVAICINRTDWDTIYTNHAEYRRCTDPVDDRDRLNLKRFPTPSEPGFYWAEWRIVETGSFPGGPAKWEDEPVDAPGHCRVVEVMNDITDDDLEKLIVEVAGCEKSQELDNFVWRSARLEPPRG